MAKFRPGGLITPSRDYLDAHHKKRLTKGKPYVLKNFGPANGVYPKGSLVLEADDIGVSSYWPVSDYQHGGPLEWSLYQPATPFTLLDDEGRKALKAGDRVLVEFDVREVDNEDSTVLLERKYDTTARPWLYVKDVFALLPPAEKPIAVGDFVNILGRTGSQGKVLAFMSNGHAVVEYAAGDNFNVSHYDLSCLKVI